MARLEDLNKVTEGKRHEEIEALEGKTTEAAPSREVRKSKAGRKLLVGDQKTTRFSVRLPQKLVEEFVQRAEKEGVRLQKLMASLMERHLKKPLPTKSGDKKE